MKIIRIGLKEYKVREARTLALLEKGLLGVDQLPNDEGMLFYFYPSLEVSMWMKDTKIPLDIIFINDDEEVISVSKGTPNNEDLITELDVAYVLEVNLNSGIKKGDTLNLYIEDEDEELPVMKVLALDGSSLMDLWGGERIFSRKNTVILIKKAKKADITNDDKDYKALGRYMFKCIKTQDERKPEYVTVPEEEK